jgi:hypothetical protein
MQTDSGMRWDDSTQTLTHIAHQPLDPERLYTIAVNEQMLRGMDTITPVLVYLAEHPEAYDRTQPLVELKDRLSVHLLGKQAAWSRLHASVGTVDVELAGDGTMAL